MATNIEWAQNPDGTKGETWNVVTGCTPISEGCGRCYARRMAYRLRGRYGYPADDPFRVTLHPDRLALPLRWKKPRTIFVNSMGDLFHKDLPLLFVQQVFDTMKRASHHLFQILTKRPEIALKRADRLPWPDNVWLGTSIENQKSHDDRWLYLRGCPASVRFFSAEPLLGPIQFDPPSRYSPDADRYGEGEFTITGLHWLIIGPETGPKRRECKPEWIRNLIDQADAASIPVFVKAFEVGGKISKNPAEWPAWARRRERPIGGRRGSAGTMSE